MAAPAIPPNPGLERDLDDLLATLERHDRSTLELRILLWLSDRDATCSELAEGLASEPGAVSHASRSLSMRGLVRRRFERGGTSGFVFDITPSGLLRLDPLIRAVRETNPTARGDR